MKRLFPLLSLFAILIFVVACSPEISFVPVEYPNTEQGGNGDNNDENSSEEDNSKEDEENKEDEKGDNNEKENDEENGNEEGTEDDNTQPDQGSEGDETNTDIDPWTGAVADDAYLDAVGSDQLED